MCFGGERRLGVRLRGMRGLMGRDVPNQFQMRLNCPLLMGVLTRFRKEVSFSCDIEQINVLQLLR